MPLWWGQINKRLFNPKALQNGKWKIINHVGRSSGRAYRTPLDAYEVDGTYVFILVYGPKSDWVRNVVASGQASLEVDDEIVELVSPRIVPGHTACLRPRRSDR
jgi:deazaflavin-dependent oxidoreductase (nitroreductase family)